MEAKQLLLVEDDDDIFGIIDYHISNLGFEFALDRAADGARGLEMALSGKYDLIVLDLMLPKLTGLDLCRKLREAGDTTPIIMLSARSEDVDKIVGLELGADDYLAKPFNAAELITRIRALLRRAEIASRPSESLAAQNDKLVFGPFSIALDRKQATREGKLLPLTSTEFELLRLLIEQAGRALSREYLAEHVLGYTTSTSDWSVNTHINRLRRKIEPNVDQPRYVLTVRGHGYRFVGADEIEG